MGHKWLLESCKLANVIFILEGATIGFATRMEVNGKRGYQVTIPLEFWTPECTEWLLGNGASKETMYYGAMYYEQGLPENILGELYLDVENHIQKSGRRETIFYISNSSDGIFTRVTSIEQIATILGVDWADKLREMEANE